MAISMLDKLIEKGNQEVKGSINKIVDVLIPSEILDPIIPTLLKVETPENLDKILKINQSIKFYLISIFSNIESLIDTWVRLMARDNIYFKTKMKNMNDEKLEEHLAGSKNKVKELKNKLKSNDSIHKAIVDGTLGKKISILQSINTKHLDWFLKNKKGKSNMESSTQFINYLDTCLALRNKVTHESFIVYDTFWITIYRKTINERINAPLKEKKVKEMVNEIFDEVSIVLNKADFNNLRDKMKKHLRREFLKKGETWKDFKKEISLEFLIN